MHWEWCLANAQLMNGIVESQQKHSWWKAMRNVSKDCCESEGDYSWLMVCRDSYLPVSADYFLPVVESGMHEALKSVFDTLLLNLIQQGGTIRLKELMTFSSELGQLETKGLPNSLSSSSILCHFLFVRWDYLQTPSLHRFRYSLGELISALVILLCVPVEELNVFWPLVDSAFSATSKVI